MIDTSSANQKYSTIHHYQPVASTHSITGNRQQVSTNIISTYHQQISTKNIRDIGTSLAKQQQITRTSSTYYQDIIHLVAHSLGINVNIKLSTARWRWALGWLLSRESRSRALKLLVGDGCLWRSCGVWWCLGWWWPFFGDRFHMATQTTLFIQTKI